jgi:hypothetical protein
MFGLIDMKHGMTKILIPENQNSDSANAFVVIAFKRNISPTNTRVLARLGGDMRH